MKKNQDFNLDKTTLREIKEKLRSMPELEVPVTLQEKLLKAIPQKRTENVAARPIRPRLGILGLGACAAMIVIVSLIFVLNLSPSGNIDETEVDFNGIVNNYPNDLNDSFIDDSNYVSNIIQRANIQRASAIFQN